MKRLLATAALVGALSAGWANLAAAQEMYLGELRAFGFNFCPVGWASANGAILSISSNAALFALLGTTYGGNGTSTFGLPNLQSRAPYGSGQGAGLPNYPLGALFGVSTVTLQVQNLPPHTHQLFGTSGLSTAGSNSPAGALLPSYPSAGDKFYSATGAPNDRPMAGNAVGLTGSGIPVNTQSPGLALTWCIATTGIFPSRP